MRILALFLALVAVASAQQTRHEELRKSANPADDLRPNSDKIPDVYTVEGQFDRVITLRFKFGADLLAGIEKVVSEQKIRNAVILSAAGSVRGYNLHQVSNRDLPSKNMFEKDPTAPADLISMNGYVINGIVHAHMTLATPEKAFGGHLEPGSEVFTFAIVTIGVMKDGVDFTHLDDKNYR